MAVTRRVLNINHVIESQENVRVNLAILEINVICVLMDIMAFPPIAKVSKLCLYTQDSQTYLNSLLLYSLLNKKLKRIFYSKLVFSRQINHGAGGYRFCRLPRECKSIADSLGSAKVLHSRFVVDLTKNLQEFCQISVNLANFYVKPEISSLVKL